MSIDFSLKLLSLISIFCAYPNLTDIQPTLMTEVDSVHSFLTLHNMSSAWRRCDLAKKA